jgi:hypothetical protein
MLFSLKPKKNNVKKCILGTNPLSASTIIPQKWTVLKITTKEALQLLRKGLWVSPIYYAKVNLRRVFSVINQVK